MTTFLYAVESSKPFDETVKAVEQKTAEKGFRVLHTHDVAATLAEKGFPREPMKIIEICNARYANQALNKDSFTRVVIRPVLAIDHESDRERAYRLLEKAEHSCLVSRSLQSKILLEPTVTVLVQASTLAA
jgi:uncharacterized protein (DUF302 family)